MLFLKWFSASWIWFVGVMFIPGLIGGLLFLPLEIVFSITDVFVGESGAVLLKTLTGIYGGIFFFAGYYIFTFYTEKISGKFLKLSHLEPDHPIGIKSFVDVLKGSRYVQKRFVTCNLILVAWAIASIFIEKGSFLLIAYYGVTVYMVPGVLIYFSMSLKTCRKEAAVGLNTNQS